MKRIYKWATGHVHSKHANKIFSALVFIEAFFFIPVTTLLSFYCIERPRESFFYATVASISSIGGSIVGYFIGYLLWDTIGERLVQLFISPAEFIDLVQSYQNYEGWGVFVACFLPIPFKLITLTAGFCKLPLYTFLIYSLIGRSLKFYTIAFFFYHLGEKVHYYLDRYFYQIVLSVAAIVGLFFLLAR